ncbi:MAG: AraC family ligand binding domain-containing protein, partial [Oscillospiraceae bacterium]
MDYKSFKLEQEICIDEVVSVHYFEFCSDYSFYGEKHPFWELLYIDKGEAEITAENRSQIMRKGEIIFHKPDEFHNVRANGVVAPNLVIFAFYCDSPAMKFFENYKATIGDTERALMGKIINEAENAFSTPLNDPQTKALVANEDALIGAQQMVKVNLEMLLIELMRSAKKETVTAPKPSSLIKGKSQQEFIERVSKYLE